MSMVVLDAPSLVISRPSAPVPDDCVSRKVLPLTVKFIVTPLLSIRATRSAGKDRSELVMAALPNRLTIRKQPSFTALPQRVTTLLASSA